MNATMITPPSDGTSTAKLFLCWTIGTMLPLALLAFGLIPPMVGLMKQAGDQGTFDINVTCAALSMALVAYFANLVFLNSSTHTPSPRGLVLFPIAVLGPIAIWVGCALTVVGVILFAQVLWRLFGVYPASPTPEILGILVGGLVALLVARAFGYIVFKAQDAALPVNEASAAIWRTAHRWGYLPYAPLALAAGSLPKGPTALSLIVCGAAIPHVILTGRAAVQAGATPRQLFFRLSILLGSIWLSVALLWMPYHGKAERAFLWPLQAVGLPADDLVWDCCEVPDRDGQVTFREHGFQFRAPPNQIAQIILEPDRQTAVELSIDRREFGAKQPPGKPRITCSSGRCVDMCADGAGCPDFDEGWYRILVLPASQPSGFDPRPLNSGPQPGRGYRCGEAGHPGLELCWDPGRIAPDVAASGVREVAYPALRQAAAYTWISKSLDAFGHPNFVATCAVTMCIRKFEYGRAKFEVTFHVQELEDWQRFNDGLLNFTKRLIVPTSD